MKKTLIVGVITCLTTTLTAQENNLANTQVIPDTSQTALKIKEFSLKDFKAPDIKYQQLTTGFSSNGSGTNSTTGSRNYFTLSGNIDANYYRFINLQNKQSRINSNIFSRFNQSGGDVQKYQHFELNLSFSNETRFYNSNKSFWGFHNLITQYTSVRDESNANNPNFIPNTIQTNNVNIQTYVSRGSGRIEPVSAGRKAMDILLSLEKYNRLTKTPTTQTIDSLATIVNKVTFQRFYDKRFKRVYQLQEVDKRIQGMGHSTNPDMVYASNLADIWDFANSFSRGSGSRWEVGLAPFLDYNFEDKEFTNSNQISEQSMYGVDVFASWNKHTPISYAWQSDWNVDVSFGYLSFHNSTNQNNNMHASLNANYVLGYFPNTRTYIGLSPYMRLSPTQWEHTERIDVSGVSGLNLSAYYYISPRFRVTATGDINYAVEVDNPQRPSFSKSLFWNSPNYQSNLVNNLNSSLSSGSDRARYQFNIRFSYAIF